MTQCRARRINEEMHCVVCRLRWDVADVEPPQCLRSVQVAPQTAPTREPFVSALAPLYVDKSY